jgi:hypothetical protein
MWAKYAIYEGIDKIPEICRAIYVYVEQSGLKWGFMEACPITHILNYI